ncbi:MAG: hypothetical protein ACJARY_001270 [Candidatus Azotimanducaceae bacterium]|jgi:hypothetical protein
MDEPKFRVMFDGKLTGEFDKAETCQRLAKLFRLNNKHAQALLSGRECVIKADLTEAAAMTYLIRMAEAGAESYVQEVLDENIPEYVEKRTDFERRQRYRREPRASSIVPDRRLVIRRASDIKQLQEIIRQGTAVPLSYASYSLNDNSD